MRDLLFPLDVQCTYKVYVGFLSRCVTGSCGEGRVVVVGGSEQGSVVPYVQTLVTSKRYLSFFKKGKRKGPLEEMKGRESSG